MTKPETTPQFAPADAAINAEASEDTSSRASAWEAATETVYAVSDAVVEAVVDISTTGVEKTKEAAVQVAGALSGLGLGSAIQYLDDAIDEQAIKSAFVGAVEAVGDKFDQVTGKQLVELLEEKLRRQDEYNNVLATRLAEALDRIALLEQRFGK